MAMRRGRKRRGTRPAFRPFKAPRQVGVFRRYRGRRAGPRSEFKFHDLDVNDAAIATNGNIAEDSCNTIVQGITESTRIGRKVTIVSIGWRYNINFPGGSNSSIGSDTIRVILYLDKQANGATASVTGILESNDYQSFNNLTNTGRFIILMDRTHDIATQGMGLAAGPISQGTEVEQNYTFFKKVNIPIEYDAETGGITEVRSNNIGVLLLSRDGSATSVIFESKMRLRFFDG